MRIRFAALVAAAALMLTGCGGGDSGDSQGASKPDTNANMVFLDAAGNLDLDPASVQNDSSFGQSVLFAIYERLLTMSGEGEIEPGLATEWGFVDGDLTQFEMTLRKGVTFHDGAKLTADVVKANLERYKALTTAGPTIKDGVENIAAVEVIDEHKILIKLVEPDSGVAFRFAMQLGMMISPNSLDGSSGLDLDPIGAGPYSMESFKPNDTTVMKRFDDFWDGPGNRPATFTVKYMSDDQTRMNALKSGQANVSLVAARQIADAEASGLEVKANATASSWMITLNTSGVLNDVKVRQAMMYALDRESLAKALSFGTSEPTTQLFLKDGPYYSDDAAKYDHDPEKAKKLLAEAGHSDGVTISWMLGNSPEYTQLGEAIQEQFAEVGITVEFKVIDISQFGIYTSGDVGDIMMVRYGGRADPLQALEVMVGDNATWSPAGAVTPKLSELIAEIAGYPDSDPARVKSVKAAAKEATDQVATIPIMTRANIFAFEPGCIQNLEPYLGAGSPDWRDVVVGEGCSVTK